MRTARYALLCILLLLTQTIPTWADFRSITVLPSAARTADATSILQVNEGRGIALLVDVTAVSSGSITAVSVDAYIGGLWVQIATFGSLTINSTTTTAGSARRFLIYPGAASAGSWTSAPLQMTVPRQYRVRTTHADANSITYSVSAISLP